MSFLLERTSKETRQLGRAGTTEVGTRAHVGALTTPITIRLCETVGEGQNARLRNVAWKHQEAIEIVEAVEDAAAVPYM